MYNSLHNNLYEEAILKPLNSGATTLKIVSGYSSPAIVHKVFMDALKQEKNNTEVELIIGMVSGSKTINSINHQDFLKLQTEKRFHCFYVKGFPPVHAKQYIWFNSEKIITHAFAGSANFSVNGLINGQIEILSEVNRDVAYNFYNDIKARSANISDVDIDFADIPQDKPENEIISGNTVTLTLLNSKNPNETPSRSGLNWGQRPELGRDPDQAYINIPAKINKTGFFPEVGIPFIMKTDDDKTLAVVRAQDNGKGLHTYESNAIMGKYFRERLGLNSGEFVTIEHLKQYGRTDVKITKINEETYYLDFSQNNKN